MLEVTNLQVKLEDEDKQILKGLTLTVPAGEVHAIMGPNGSGKSTLSYVLSGRDGYEVTGGTATLDGAECVPFVAPSEDGSATAAVYTALDGRCMCAQPQCTRRPARAS